MFGLALLQAAIQLPIAMIHYTDQSDRGSAFFEAWTLLLWLLSMVYYRKRREQLT
jgi:heme/copper-type cytochrome/quinol oxidase subunit 4